MNKKYDNGIIQNLKRTFSYATDVKKEMIIWCCFNIITAIISLLLPIFVSKEIIYISSNSINDLFLAALIISILYIVEYSIYFIDRALDNRIINKFTLNIQMADAVSFLQIKSKQLNKKSTGFFIDRLNNDAKNISQIFDNLMKYAVQILSSIGVFIGVFIINKYIFLYLLTVTLLHFLFNIKLYKEIEKRQKSNKEISEKITGFSSEFVRGVTDIKVLYAKNSFIDGFKKQLNVMYDNDYNTSKEKSVYVCLLQFFDTISDFIFILICIYFMKYNIVPIASIIVLFTYKNQTISLNKTVSDFISYLNNYNMSANRVFELIDGDMYEKEEFGNRHLNKIDGNIEFKDVCFSYDDKRQILNNLNFKVKKDETVAFVGKSGAGKSTIFNLIGKLYDANQGHIYLDGIDINDLDEESIRNNMTIITQSPYIFNMSIRDNLSIVTKNLSDTKMKEAIKLACLDEFVEGLPDKYDTIIGENGITLSGGEKQRLAIARALVQNTKIILFDEATSSLDNETQLNISEAINNMKSNYTILIIAHRLSTILKCIRILFVDDGKIIADGTHQELLKKCDKYKKLYQAELQEVKKK